jgi:hypothetical protein
MTKHETLTNDDVDFNANIIAAAWEEFGDGIPAVAAAAIINEFYDYTVTANEATESDRDVLFPNVDVMVEEKTMGVCDVETAEKHATMHIELDRQDGKVLALNGAAVYENHTVPA